MTPRRPPTLLPVLALELLRPQTLRRQSQARLDALTAEVAAEFATLQAAGGAIENLVNVGVWLQDEYQRRQRPMPALETPWGEAVRTLAAQAQPAHKARLAYLPERLPVVEHFISLVGSALEKAQPPDVDVLIRADMDPPRQYLLLDYQHVTVPLRKVLDPDKSGDLHLLSGAQGSHGDFLPLYDLVLLRRPEATTHVVKSATAMAAMDAEVLRQHLVQAPAGPRLDLGCGGHVPDGFIGVDQDPDSAASVHVDLEQGIPYPDQSVAVLRAHHCLEHLTDTSAIMQDIFRVLMPGGLAVITVPSTRGEGAFAHPDHNSFWNRSSFAFWSDPRLVEDRPCFECLALEDVGQDPALSVVALLRKPLRGASWRPRGARAVGSATPSPADHRDGPQRPAAAAVAAETASRRPQDYRGLFLGLPLPTDLATQLALPGGERPEDLHVTLLYLPECEDPIAIGTVLGIAAALTCTLPPITGQLSGVARFDATPGSDGKDVLVALYDSPALEQCRAHLLQALAAAGVPCEQNHGYTPHVTLQYLEADDRRPLPESPHRACTLDTLQVKHGGALRATYHFHCAAVTKADTFQVGDAFTPPKPARADYTADGSLDAVQHWATAQRFPLAVEPKHNGFRALVSRDDRRTRLWFADAPAVDHLPKFPDLAEALGFLPPHTLLDGDLGAVLRADSTRVPRSVLNTFNAKQPRLERLRVVFTVFDVVVLHDADVHSQPFERRREHLETLCKGQTSATFQLSPVRWCHDHGDLPEAVRWAMQQPLSEGAMLKAGTSAYALDGETPQWFKLKKIVDLKVRVLAVTPLKTGQQVYAGGLLVAPDDPWENRLTVAGTEYVLLGKTYSSRIAAQVGDIVTVTVLELIDDGLSLVWLGAVVQDVDHDRERPDTAQQVHSRAARGGVLQVVGAGSGKSPQTVRRPSGPPVQKRVEGVDPTTEGETRSQAAANFWAEHWHECYPEGGTGRFVYHHHWRGLSKAETRLSDAALLQTAHSLHGDLRFAFNDQELWGFTVFLGSSRENRDGERLFSLTGAERLRGQFKLVQPHAWLDVGRPEPLVVEPAGVGATSQKYAKFFALDHGTYRMGVWRQHAIEIVLQGTHLQGRLLFQYAPVAPQAEGQRGAPDGRADQREASASRPPGLWLLSRPQDQTPLAAATSPQGVLQDLRRSRQRYAVWHDPRTDTPPVPLDTRQAGRLLKADPERRTVYGVVLDPYTIDSQDDWCSPRAIEETAHAWLRKSRQVNVDHEREIAATPVESFLMPYPTEADYHAALAGDPHRVFAWHCNDSVVHSGAWVLAVYIEDPATWQRVLDGDLQAYSIGGSGVRMALDLPAQGPQVTEVLRLDLEPTAMQQAVYRLPTVHKAATTTLNEADQQRVVSALRLLEDIKGFWPQLARTLLEVAAELPLLNLGKRSLHQLMEALFGRRLTEAERQRLLDEHVIRLYEDKGEVAPPKGYQPPELAPPPAGPADGR